MQTEACVHDPAVRGANGNQAVRTAFNEWLRLPPPAADRHVPTLRGGGAL